MNMVKFYEVNVTVCVIFKLFCGLNFQTNILLLFLGQGLVCGNRKSNTLNIDLDSLQKVRINRI